MGSDLEQESEESKFWGGASWKHLPVEGQSMPTGFKEFDFEAACLLVAFSLYILFCFLPHLDPSKQGKLVGKLPNWGDL